MKIKEVKWGDPAPFDDYLLVQIIMGFSVIKDKFLTVAYKQGWIHSYNWRNIITGKSGERITYTPVDGAGQFVVKSRHAAKLAITNWSKR